MQPVSSSLRLMLILMCLVYIKSPAEQTATNDDAVRRATFIFTGTVSKLNASTMPDVKPSDTTAVVRVDEVIDGVGAPPDLAGKEITVKLAQPGSVSAGQKYTFFTRGWLMGESMAVVEVAPPQEAGSSPQVREMVQAVRQKSADEALQAEISSAEVIVAGSVTSVAPAGTPELPTEHTPHMQKATIAVQSTLKGHITGKDVTVFFPESEDPYWRGAPKFKQGQEGIWLLHRHQLDVRGMENQFTALNPLDFQAREQQGRIQQLLKSKR